MPIVSIQNFTIIKLYLYQKRSIYCWAIIWHIERFTVCCTCSRKKQIPFFHKVFSTFFIQLYVLCSIRLQRTVFRNICDTQKSGISMLLCFICIAIRELCNIFQRQQLYFTFKCQQLISIKIILRLSGCKLHCKLRCKLCEIV